MERELSVYCSREGQRDKSAGKPHRSRASDTLYTSRHFWPVTSEHIYPPRISRQRKKVIFSERANDPRFPLPRWATNAPLHSYWKQQIISTFIVPGKVIILAMPCHNFHLRHLLWNKRVIQAANVLYMTEWWEGNGTRMRTTSTQASQTAFPVCGSTCFQSLKCAVIIEPNGANENALRQIKRKP